MQGDMPQELFSVDISLHKSWHGEPDDRMHLSRGFFTPDSFFKKTYRVSSKERERKDGIKEYY
jgi:hypothetical protein